MPCSSLTRAKARWNRLVRMSAAAFALNHVRTVSGSGAARSRRHPAAQVHRSNPAPFPSGRADSGAGRSSASSIRLSTAVESSILTVAYTAALMGPPVRPSSARPTPANCPASSSAAAPASDALPPSSPPDMRAHWACRAPRPRTTSAVRRRTSPCGDGRPLIRERFHLTDDQVDGLLLRVRRITVLREQPLDRRA